MGSQSDQLKNILQKEMSRKEFLKVSGAAILGLIGVSGFIQNLHKLSGTASTQAPAQVKTAKGYGTSAYGR